MPGFAAELAALDMTSSSESLKQRERYQRVTAHSSNKGTINTQRGCWMIMYGPMQEHESMDDAVKGSRMERRSSVDARRLQRPGSGDKAAARQRQPVLRPPAQPLQPAPARVMPEAARPWTYLRPPHEQVASMTCISSLKDCSLS